MPENDPNANPATEAPPPVATDPKAPAPAPRAKDDPDPGAVYVRACPACGDLVQTRDGSGKSPCMVCKDKAPAPAAPAPGATPSTPEAAAHVAARRR